MDNAETKVLLVDDNLAVRKIARLFLINAGFAVEVADDADNALKILSSQSFDVLITDMIMPGTMTGLDLILFVQEHYPNTQCGLISGLSDGQIDGTRGDVKDLKMLSKPFSKADIVDLVKQLGS